MQRGYETMLALVLDIARNDERIRAVTMEGSRANPNAVHDEYSDLDICYYVRDVREFTRDHHLMYAFGEILIVQCPDDWYKQPYNYESRDTYCYLIQLQDGNRIDLHVVDISNIAGERENDEPRVVLLNKDGFEELQPLDSEAEFYIQKPTEREYAESCNEFRWVSTYITKGLCRRELYYAKKCYEWYVMEQFIKVLNWKVGVDHDFAVTTGANSKYLKRYLSEEEMKRLQGIFPNGEYEDIWEKLFLMYDYFEENACYVADKLGFAYNETEATKVREFHVRRLEQWRSGEVVKCE